MAALWQQRGSVTTCWYVVQEQKPSIKEYHVWLGAQVSVKHLPGMCKAQH
jgi:hypothetical protein